MKSVYKLMLALSFFCTLSATIDDDLIQAAADGNLEAVQSSFNQGANIHADRGEALRLAAKNGHLSVVEFLSNHGANIHAHYDEAVQLAAKNGHLSTVAFLLNHGADSTGTLPAAAENGHLSIVELLLNRGADIHAWADEALRLASEKRHSDVVELLKLCSNPAFEIFRTNPAEFIEHNIAIHPNQLVLWSVVLNRPDILDTLLEKYPAAVNAAYITEEAGIMTALMFATSFGFGDIARKLLLAGANINVQNKDGKNAMQLAADYGQFTVATQLLAWQKDISLF